MQNIIYTALKKMKYLSRSPTKLATKIQTKMNSTVILTKVNRSGYLLSGNVI